MTEQAKFKCLRCGQEYSASFDPDLEPQERSCPKCRSNSQRRLKEDKKKEASSGGKK